MDNIKTIIGKDVIESLTIGMYEDSRFIYREYIQNSADQIDKALKENLLKKGEDEIHIEIDSEKKSILIEDNATGISKSKVNDILKNIAQSTKERGIDKGFRGIGRLGGLGYCDSLIFETSFKGENIKSRMVWNAKLLKEIINNRISKEEAAHVIDKVTNLKFDSEEPDKHYFKVCLLNVTNETLLNKKEIEAYLSMVAPVPYDKSFIFRQEIYNYININDIKIDEYKIFINTNQIFKPYSTIIYKSANGKKQRSGDEIFNINLFKECFSNELLYWGWYGISKFDAVIDETNISRGIRLRKENIQIGDSRTLIRFFKEQRGNYYFFGEIHAINPDLIPNARRDYFLENTICLIFEENIENFFHTILHSLYYAASRIRSANKKIIDLQVLKEECKNKEFINNNEKEEFIKTFDQRKKEAVKAKKDLEKIRANFNDNNSAIQKIFKKVVNTNSIIPENIELESKNNKNGKTVYRTDKLSQLSKNERKFISKIFQIIKEVLDDKTAENLIIKIEEDFS